MPTRRLRAALCAAALTLSLSAPALAQQPEPPDRELVRLRARLKLLEERVEQLEGTCRRLLEEVMVLRESGGGRPEADMHDHLAARRARLAKQRAEVRARIEALKQEAAQALMGNDPPRYRKAEQELKQLAQLDDELAGEAEALASREGAPPRERVGEAPPPAAQLAAEQARLARQRAEVEARIVALKEELLRARQADAPGAGQIEQELEQLAQVRDKLDQAAELMAAQRARLEGRQAPPAGTIPSSLEEANARAQALLNRLGLVLSADPLPERMGPYAPLSDYVKGGLSVADVVRDGPAHRAGVSPGMILLAVNEIPVGSPEVLVKVLAQAGPPAVRLTLFRPTSGLPPEFTVELPLER